MWHIPSIIIISDFRIRKEICILGLFMDVCRKMVVIFKVKRGDPGEERGQAVEGV